ncbi:unnamed protein product [Mycena citricolor]|uniref:Uncharacterized protein n=2 Tax=Mycena citricolor TaxID=2018698 RepID=A0AAD2HW85_9AGAR|nr:unnamed protein product [Mycena citricolor]
MVSWVLVGWCWIRARELGCGVSFTHILKLSVLLVVGARDSCLDPWPSSRSAVFPASKVQLWHMRLGFGSSGCFGRSGTGGIYSGGSPCGIRPRGTYSGLCYFVGTVLGLRLCGGREAFLNSEHLP